MILTNFEITGLVVLVAAHVLAITVVIIHTNKK